jgi:hypothetical protein
MDRLALLVEVGAQQIVRVSGKLGSGGEGRCRRSLF